MMRMSITANLLEADVLALGDKPLTRLSDDLGLPLYPAFFIEYLIYLNTNL